MGLGQQSPDIHRIVDIEAGIDNDMVIEAIEAIKILRCG